MTEGSAHAYSTRAPIALFALVAIAWSVFVATIFHPELVSNDGAQYLSIASNIAAGHGNATSLLTYEQHFVTGLVPAPQTVFPPGYSYLTAMLSQAGLAAERAGFITSLACHLLGCVILFHLLWRAARLSLRMAAALTIAWLLLAINLSLVADALSEPAFVLVTLASTWCYWRSVTAGRLAMGWLIASGVLAATALQVRYAGMFFIAGAGLALLLQWLRAPDLRGALRIVLWGMPSAAALAATFWRNYALLGTIRGGPGVEASHSVSDIVRRFYWSTNATFGWGVGGDIYEWLATLAAVAAFSLMIIARLRHSDPHGSHLSPRLAWVTTPLSSWSLAYLGVSLAALMWMSATTPSPVSVRYLHPLWPFACLALAPLLAPKRAPVRSPQLSYGATALLSAAFVLGQWRLHQEMWPALVRPEPRTSIDRILAAGPGRVTLAACLRTLTADHTPLFTNEPQQVGLSADIPTLGLPSAFYAVREWDADSVLGLMDRYSVRWVLFLPTVYDAQLRQGMDQASYYARFRHHDPPPGLRVAARHSEYLLYERLGSAAAGSTENALPVECPQSAQANRGLREQPAS